MKSLYLGDSYDIVKQSFLRWLGTLGAWRACPMFTEVVDDKNADLLSGLLGIPLLSKDVLNQETDRKKYFSLAIACQDHLFLDPDTGLRLMPIGGKNHPLYLFGPEVVELVLSRPKGLTLVFDQALPRGREREHLRKKMAFFAEHRILSFAYVSHACFILMSSDPALMGRARDVVQKESRLPEARFLNNNIEEA